MEKRYFDKYGHINKISEVVNGMESELFIFIYGDLTSPQVALDCIEAMYTLDNEYGLDISAKSKLLKIVDKRQEYTYNLQCDRYNCWIYYYDNVGNIKYVKEYKFGKEPHNVKVSNRDGYGRITQKDTYIGTDVGKLYYTTVKNIEYENKFSNDITSEETETGLSETASLKLNSSYAKDNFTRPTVVQVKDENNNGYRQEITYLTKGYRESMSGDLIGPTPSEPPYVATGETNIIDEVKTYGIVSGTETLEKTEKLSYDPNGNYTRYGDNTYEYDGIGRLTRENNADLNKSFTYEYDTRGNVISKKEYAYTRITLGAVVSTQNYTYNGYDRLTNTGYVYDNLGNPTSYNGKTLTWKGNSLNSFAKSGITYALGYDWQRLLHCKTYTKNSKEIKEYYYYDGTRRTYDEIYYGNEVYPTALSYAYNKLGIAGFYLYDSQGGNTGSYTYRKNLFGDITAIYQGSTCVAKYKYDAWGNCTVCNPDGTTNASDSFIGNINPFRYRGYYWDKDLQLYYLQTRWYDPIIGRFISPDSVEYLDPESFGGLNLYAYCLNNPIMYVDPSGCIPEWLEWTLLGVGVALSLAAITVGGFVTGGLLSSVLIGAGVGFLTGASTDIIYQGVENNWDFSQINISAALKTGAIDATIGAITGLFSFTIGQLGQQIGEYIGHTISNYKIFGRSIGQIYSYFGGTSMLMAVGGYVGGKIAGFVGASYGFYVANNAFGKQNTIEDTLNEGYKNLFHWIISIFM